MKIAMVRVPTIIDATASTAPICPPLGMAYLKRVVRSFTDQIQVIDSIGNHPAIREVENEEAPVRLLGQTAQEIADQLDATADIVLVSIMFSQDWPYSRQCLAAIRRKCPDALIIAGGEHITAVPEYSLESCSAIDLCVMGEGEQTLATILEMYRHNRGRCP